MMGLFHMSVASEPGTAIRLGNPNPARFSVIRSHQVGQNLVAMLHYHGVTNYEGIKTLLYLNKTATWLNSRTFLDPHFQKDHPDAPFARFEPTDDGWRAAIRLAELVACG